jgi:hypothetical protein
MKPSFQEAGKAINEKVRLYAQVGQALIEAKDGGSDPFEAIERVMSWEQFTQSVQEAEKLARPEDFDYLGLLSNHYSRRYYELCTITELRNALRSGDIWVPGSRQFKDFEDYLLHDSCLRSIAPLRRPAACYRRKLPSVLDIERRSCAMNCKKSMGSPRATNARRRFYRWCPQSNAPDKRSSRRS